MFSEWNAYSWRFFCFCLVKPFNVGLEGIMQSQDNLFMQRCLELASEVRGETFPNPLVGSVIVLEGEILAEGLHRKAGTPHAEIMAFTDLDKRGFKGDLSGATLYVNLEPCSHHGKTPPCADEIIRRGVGRVVFGLKDANPLVAGKGLEKLQQAGIEVVGPVLEKESYELNREFFHHLKFKRTFFSLKMATTIDGCLADKFGTSKWITNAKSRDFGHLWRSYCDGLLVGVGTILADDPSLNLRIKGEEKKKKVIVLDPHLKTPLDAKIFQANGEENITLIYDSSASNSRLKDFQKLGVQLLPMSFDLFLDLKTLGEKLFTLGFFHLLVEGGAKTHRKFLEQNMVDRILHFVAPKLLGIRENPHTLFGGGIAASLSQASEFELQDLHKLDNDFLAVYLPGLSKHTEI